MKDFKEDIKKIFESKKVLILAIIIGFLIIFAVIFKAGEIVGSHRASFGNNWERNYEKNFGMMRGPGRDGFLGGISDNLPNANGSVGKIIKVELPTIVVQDRDGLEKSVLINKDTVIRLMRQDVNPDTLRVNNFVVIIGSPNTTGQIEAKLIRIMPDGLPITPILPTPGQTQ